MCGNYGSRQRRILRSVIILMVSAFSLATSASPYYGGWDRHVAFSPDGQYVALSLGLRDLPVQTIVWSVADGRRTAVLPIYRNISFDGKGRLAVSSWEGDPEIKLVEPSSGRTLNRFSVGPDLTRITWANDGTLFTEHSSFRGPIGPVRRWSVDGRKIAEWGPYTRLELSPDGRWAVLAEKLIKTQSSSRFENEVRLVDMSTGSRVRVWPEMMVLGFSKEALYLQRENFRDWIKVDLATLEEKSWRSAPRGRTWPLPNGLLASSDDKIEIREFGKEEPRFTFPELGHASPDGRWFACRSGVWSLLNGEQVASFPGNPDWDDGAFSPDSRYLFRATWKEGAPVPTTTLHDLHTGTQRTLR